MSVSSYKPIRATQAATNRFKLTAVELADLIGRP
jgi:hypothetical protein